MRALMPGFARLERVRTSALRSFSRKLVYWFRIVDHDSLLLMHPIKMMDRANAVPQRMRVGDRGGNVGFGQQDGFR